MNQEKIEKAPYKVETLSWTKFNYIDQLVNWFNEHQEFRLVSFSVGKGNDCFVAIYTNKEKLA